MRRILHVLTKPEDSLSKQVVALQKDGLEIGGRTKFLVSGRRRPGNSQAGTPALHEEFCPAPLEIEIIDLTRGQPDYDQLLEAVFKADSVQVW